MTNRCVRRDAAANADGTLNHLGDATVCTIGRTVVVEAALLLITAHPAWVQAAPPETSGGWRKYENNPADPMAAFNRKADIDGALKEKADAEKSLAAARKAPTAIIVRVSKKTLTAATAVSTRRPRIMPARMTTTTAFPGTYFPRWPTK